MTTSTIRQLGPVSISNLADLMMKLGKKTEPKICRSKAA